MEQKPILRDELGRVLPGSGGLPGAGRPFKKRSILDKLMKQFYGEDCEQILLNMIEIAEYNPDVDFENTKPSKKRFFKPKFTSQQIVDARKFLFEHFFNKPVQENYNENENINLTPEDITINVNVSPDKQEK